MLGAVLREGAANFLEASGQYQGFSVFDTIGQLLVICFLFLCGPAVAAHIFPDPWLPGTDLSRKYGSKRRNQFMSRNKLMALPIT